MFDVAQKIEELRKKHGWTVYKLSMETGLSQQAIHSWYNSNKKILPTIATIEVICKAFNMSLAEFFTEISPTETNKKTKTIFEKFNNLTHEEQKIISTLIDYFAKNK